jgi:hypothetical protein
VSVEKGASDAALWFKAEERFPWAASLPGWGDTVLRFATVEVRGYAELRADGVIIILGATAWQRGPMSAPVLVVDAWDVTLPPPEGASRVTPRL